MEDVTQNFNFNFNGGISFSSDCNVEEFGTDEKMHFNFNFQGS